MHLGSNPKLQLCRQHVPLEALYLVVGGLIVPPKGNAACTAAILDSLSCHHHYICVKPFQKGVLEGNVPKNWKFSSNPLHFKCILV